MYRISYVAARPKVYTGSAFRIRNDRDEAVLEDVRRFVEIDGYRPDQDSWAAAGLRPSERTVRRRFGSFAAALAAAEVPRRRAAISHLMRLAPLSCSRPFGRPAAR